MKIKLKNKENPVTQNWCFKNEGFCSTLLEEINSGKEVTVDRIPKPAREFVEEVKNQVKKETKKETKKQVKKGDK